MSKVSLNILIKNYNAGRISREEFMYFHTLLAKQEAGNQALDIDAIINNATRKSAPPAVKKQPPPVAPAKPQASPPASKTIDIDNSSSGYESSEPSDFKDRASVGQVIAQFFSERYKQTAALVGIIGVVSTLVTNDFTSSDDDVRSTNVVRSMNLDDSDSDDARSRSKSGIESLAWKMIDKKPWGRSDIHKFTRKWQKLSTGERKKAKKSAWYRQFSLVLTTNLAQQSSLANDGNISAVYVERALSELTDSMNSNGAGSKLATRQAFERLRENDSSNDSGDRSSSALRSKTRKVKAAKVITQRDINKLLDRYIDNYEDGEIRAIAKLFTNGRRNANKRYANATLNEYRSVFKNTQSRTLEIDDLDWNIEGDIADGEGSYSSILELSNNSRKEVIADIKFRLSVRGNSVLFDSIKLVNLEANAIPSQVTLARRDSSIQSEPAVKAKPFVEGNKKNRRMLVGSKEYKAIYSDRAKPKNIKRKPTKSELNDLVARYVDSYQYGDADEMITLFSGATWTKDRSGIIAMRQDYQDIFDSTSSRKMTIDNLRWKFKKDKALGTGNLTLSSVQEEFDTSDSELSLKKGKIRLVVELRDDEALISHLYQIFN